MFNYKKIASVLASAVMLSSTIGFAAALNYPAPFVTSGTADAAVVVGLNADISDLNAAIDVGQSLNTLVTVGSGTSTGSSVTGGDSVLLAKSNNNLNLGNTWGVFTGTIDDDDLMTLLADGTYRADDNDEFDYDQKINLGSPTLTHFSDTDYDEIVGTPNLQTPTLGFKLSDGTFILNYTLDFTEEVESVVTGGDLVDIEGSDIMLLGRSYYVSDMKNSTLKMTLLDSAVVSSVGEGSSTTVNVKDKSYAVSIVFIDNDEVVFDINGERAPSSGKLEVGDSFRLNDGAYIGVRDISKLEIAGETGTSSFSIGSGKLELEDGSDIELNDVEVDGVKAYITRGTYSSPDERIDKIVIEWKTDDEVFLTQDSELIMPGFEAVKFSMGSIIKNSEEMVRVQRKDDTSIELTVPMKDGSFTFGILYSNSSGEFTGIGESSTKKLRTAVASELIFSDQIGGSNSDEYFIATYNDSSEGESYLLRATTNEASSPKRNETDIQRRTATGWETVCDNEFAGETCDIGDVTLTINTVSHTSTDKSVNLTGSSGVSFNTIYTAGGLKIYLPYEVTNTTITDSNGAVNFTDSSATAIADNGQNYNQVYLYFDEEDRNDDIIGGTQFSVTLDDTSEGNVQVSAINSTGGGAGSGNGGENGLEIGDTDDYESYVISDVATRIVHNTGGDEDSVEIYYPSGNSETYAEVFLAEVGASITPGATGGAVGEGGQVLIVKDSEMSSVSGKNLVVIGGSCINTAAAKILNSDSPLCGSAFTDVTGVGSNQYIIKTVTSPWANDKVAMLVAGYEAADTANAVRKAMEGTLSDADTQQVYPIVSA